jgi:hypothetical protein
MILQIKITFVKTEVIFLFLSKVSISLYDNSSMKTSDYDIDYQDIMIINIKMLDKALILLYANCAG